MPAYTTDARETGGRSQWLLAILAVGLGLLLLYLPEPAQQSLAAGIRNSVLQPFVATQASLVRSRARNAAVEELQAERDALVSQLSILSAMGEENRHLRGLLELRERAGPGFLAASAVRPGTRGSESLFVVNLGAGDGVRPYAPVVTPDGLAGVIREVSPRSALGMDWTHPDFRASAMTADGEVYGMVEPRRGEFREIDRLVFNGIAYHSVLEPGTVVVTSGRGGVYPRGIEVGIVEELEAEEAGWRRSYWLRPAVAPGSITHVLVGVSEPEWPDPSENGDGEDGGA